MIAYLTNVSLTDLLIIIGIAGVAVKTVMEGRGWTRSSQVLRRENEDLSRRNADLEHTTERQTSQIEELTLKVAVLEREVAEIRTRDQAAVLTRLAEVEVKADDRHTETVTVLKRIAANTSPPVQVTETNPS